jgi:undecaprenyl-diphosphatase
MAEVDLLQIIILSIIQAITEFLPISSSAHLLLPSKLLGWPDQGIIFDITVHAATLAAVLLFFRKEFLDINFYKSRMFMLLILATMPLVASALLIPGLGDYRWTLSSIAFANIVFGILLLISTYEGKENKQNSRMKVWEAVFIGLFQCFSLISGASRSGTAITAALFLGFNKTEAAKFSLMLSIPTIAGAILFSFLDINNLETDISILTTITGFLTTFIFAYLSIDIFLKVVKSIGYTPFILYRMLLGILILWLI